MRAETLVLRAGMVNTSTNFNDYLICGGVCLNLHIAASV